MNTIIEQIKAEVERQAKSIKNATGDFAEGRRMEQRIILSVLDTLQEKSEKPINPNIEICPHSTKSKSFSMRKEQSKPEVSEDLESEIERYLSTEWELDEDLNKNEPIYIYDCTWEDLKVLARHFAQWQKEKDNEVADKALTTSIKLQEGWYAKGIADGEKSMKEQMMKEAVEGRVVDAGIFATYNTPVEYTHSGDKVKIIIIKES